MSKSFMSIIDLFQIPRVLGKTPEGEEITACLGRFGPYLNYGEKKNLSLRNLEWELPYGLH